MCPKPVLRPAALFCMIFGQIYSNLNVALKGVEDGNFHTYVTAKPGSGPRYAFESKYGNVYLRKP